MLFELPFYEELNVIKANWASRGYAKSYKFELVEKKDPIEFAPVHFNSTTKTVINHEFILESAFEEILYRIDH